MARYIWKHIASSVFVNAHHYRHGISMGDGQMTIKFWAPLSRCGLSRRDCTRTACDWMDDSLCDTTFSAQRSAQGK